MSGGNNLTTDGELRYMIQWFNEWSELQRQDFLPILLECLSPESYVNGLVGGMAEASCNDKPMSLFQCRVKLFREWSSKWPQNIKEKLSEKVAEIDPTFGDKFTNELQILQTNGTNSSVSEASDAVNDHNDKSPTATQEY
ncbi:uncharacterized protein C14orf119 [Lutzomyia longipalpis]|uniref:Uncharacterized protein n=1 Tax=Lutzomyia longipalpis TaxID=7200 RepID=A0A1B0CSV3_LUTLO|nr:uncharacterized protein C14orf119 [Lutzomyia longipalpis]